MEDRRVVWLLVLGALAFIIGVVALFIAIDAKNSSTSDQELANSVRTQIEDQVPRLKGALSSQSKAIATAGARLRQAERAQKRLAGGQAIDRGDLRKLSSQIDSVKGGVKGVQADVNNLTNDVNGLKNQQSRTRDTITTLSGRVDRLQTQVQQKKNK